jgi:hypothetical protein
MESQEQERAEAEKDKVASQALADKICEKARLKIRPQRLSSGELSEDDDCNNFNSLAYDSSKTKMRERMAVVLTATKAAYKGYANIRALWTEAMVAWDIWIAIAHGLIAKEATSTRLSPEVKELRIEDLHEEVVMCNDAQRTVRKKTENP